MLALNRVAVTYGNGTQALKPTSLKLAQGQFVVLLGRSGAGKSTLIRTLNGLVAPTSGSIIADAVGSLDGERALRVHRRRTGMIFQQHQLIGRLSALDNVMTGRLGYHSSFRTLFPLPRSDRQLGLECLARVGLLDKALVRADQLSGGQQQRVGIARALVQQPRLILADEPVASLDPETAVEVLSQLRHICTTDGITAVISLHQIDLARRFGDRVIAMRDGSVVADASVDELTDQMCASIYRSEASGRSSQQAHHHSSHSQPQPVAAMEAAL
tara:strand:+ start:288 stop:1103 length:816 start_codon:yes stop_codon:yes gene_type:complete